MAATGAMSPYMKNINVVLETCKQAQNVGNYKLYKLYKITYAVKCHFHTKKNTINLYLMQFFFGYWDVTDMK